MNKNQLNELYVKFELQKQGLILFRAVLFPPRVNNKVKNLLKQVKNNLLK
jgi:hypothetical protein